MWHRRITIRVIWAYILTTQLLNNLDTLNIFFQDLCSTFWEINHITDPGRCCPVWWGWLYMGSPICPGQKWELSFYTRPNHPNYPRLWTFLSRFNSGAVPDGIALFSIWDDIVVWEAVWCHNKVLVGYPLKMSNKISHSGSASLCTQCRNGQHYPALSGH